MKKRDKNTKIEWAQKVWNYLTGCTKISAGCKHCYMFILAVRLQLMGQEKYRNGAKLTIHEHELSNPYQWKRPAVVFVNSMSDSYHEEVPITIHQGARKVMIENPHHTFLDLTKRVERLLEIQNELEWPENLWSGVSVENERVLHRVDSLRKSTAKHKWISAEPLIGPLTDLDLTDIDWVVVGGEAGNRKDLRPIKEEWVVEIMEKCRAKGIPFFFKQWGKKHFNPNPDDPTQVKGHPEYAKGGCQLQGKVYREFPESFKNNFNQIEMKKTSIENKNEKTIEANATILSKEYLDSLTPIKKELGVLINTGLSPYEAAAKLSKENNKTFKTYKAFATMVMGGSETFNTDIMQISPEIERKDAELSSEEKSILTKCLDISRLISIEPETIFKIDTIKEKLKA